MDFFITYFTYFLVCLAFLIPFIGFCLGATSIIKTTLASFSINFFCFITNKDFLNKKIQENKIFGKFLNFLELYQTKEEREIHSPKNDHHIVDFKQYSFVFLILFFLTVITVAVAQFDFGGAINITVAMIIATFKASLVVLYFMHLKYDNTYNKVIFITAIVFVILLYSFSLFDIITRHPIHLEF